MRNAQSFRILVFLLLLLTILGISGPHLVHKLVPVITHPVTLPHWPSVFFLFLEVNKTKCHQEFLRPEVFPQGGNLTFQFNLEPSQIGSDIRPQSNHIGAEGKREIHTPTLKLNSHDIV